MNEVNEVINVPAIAKQSRELNASELLGLLKSDFVVFITWAAEEFTIDDKRNPRVFRMTVNGHHHKGYVYINVNGMDLFDFYLTTFDNVITYKIEGLYFDQLVESIDEKIEKLSTYKF